MSWYTYFADFDKNKDIPLAYFGVFSYCSADYFLVFISRPGIFFELLSTGSYHSVNGFSQLYLQMADTLSAL